MEGQKQKKHKVIIIGAGPAGLAAAACLQREGIPYVMLEKSQEVATSWQGHYERLHLHTVKEESALPHLPLPSYYPRYPSRQQMVQYFQLYRETFAIRPLLGVTVQGIVRESGGWRVQTNVGDWTGRDVVVATGRNHRPSIPQFPGEESFPGAILHSREYKRGEEFRQQKVLVIGAGNSGAEIALDLWEHGAQVTLCIRSPIHVVPRESLGSPTQVTNIRLSRLPGWLADGMATLFLRLTVGDLRPYGIERPPGGPRKYMRETGRVPLIDLGTVSLIKEKRIGVVPGIGQMRGRQVTFVNGETREFDAIIKATGYRPGVADLFSRNPRGEELVDHLGLPRRDGWIEQHYPGLHFSGFHDGGLGTLREISREARELAYSISRRPRQISAGEGMSDLTPFTPQSS